MGPKNSVIADDLSGRIRRRRQDLGASVGQVSEWSDLDAEEIERIETGEPFTTSKLGRICRGLAVDTGAMLHGQETSVRRSVARFRQASSTALTGAQTQTLAPSDLRVIALCAELGRIGGFLASKLGREVYLERETKPVQAHPSIWQQGYELGEKARPGFQPPAHPIDDIEGSMKQQGVHVARAVFEAPIDAVSLREEGALPVVVLNGRGRSYRSSLSRRPLLAHEICHLIHDSGEMDLTTQISWSGENADPVEQRANAFGPAFLAPPTEVRFQFSRGPGASLSTPEEIAEALARKWGLSFKGAAWHAKNCGVMEARDADRLQTEAPTKHHDWEADFELSRPRYSLVSGLLEELVDESVEKGVISEGRGREILSWE